MPRFDNWVEVGGSDWISNSKVTYFMLYMQLSKGTKCIVYDNTTGSIKNHLIKHILVYNHIYVYCVLMHQTVFGL